MFLWACPKPKTPISISPYNVLFSNTIALYVEANEGKGTDWPTNCLLGTQTALAKSHANMPCSNSPRSCKGHNLKAPKHTTLVHRVLWFKKLEYFNFWFSDMLNCCIVLSVRCQSSFCRVTFWKSLKVRPIVNVNIVIVLLYVLLPYKNECLLFYFLVYVCWNNTCFFAYHLCGANILTILIMGLVMYCVDIC